MRSNGDTLPLRSICFFTYEPRRALSRLGSYTIIDRRDEEMDFYESRIYKQAKRLNKIGGCSEKCSYYEPFNGCFLNMTKINSLYDALIDYEKPENQCTNFLVWLLDKLPSEVLSKICDKSNLSIPCEIQNSLNIEVQSLLENSTPDAIIGFSYDNYIIIETKLYPNSFDKEQFINHFEGGCKKFGYEKIWLLFLSGDENIPEGLDDLILEHKGKIGHISWNSILKLLKDNKESLGEKYEIIINEFLTFAKHYKLGRLIYMNPEEMKKFIENFAEMEKFRKPCTDKLLETIDMIKHKIIINSQEEVEAYNGGDFNNKELPCLWKCLKIKGWHTDGSAYIYINILQKLIGICLVGYEDKDARNKFSKRWAEDFNDKHKKDSRLKTFTWIEEDDDELAINGGYFKEFEGTTGKSFNPVTTPFFSKKFYFGYNYELNIPDLKALEETIAVDFKTLLERFKV
ncbi:MAG: hypothetical protein O8C64_14245 [Candidatus Methanoperedens sp.]|nr:hypothetical protein [Candidatus Methanoperedens sp.]MCZ7405777.1 hypothetical protein [Candidatus Methanoperedens sp.]